MIVDYASLQAAIVDYLARDQDTFLTARIPTLIRLFEAKMNRSLFVRQMEQRSTAVTFSQISAPSLTTVTTSASGGALAAATYYYVVTALNAGGETVASNEFSITTTGATSSNTLTWGAVTNATSYKVYRGTVAAGESVYYSLGLVTSFVDAGAAGTAGSPPQSSSIEPEFIALPSDFQSMRRMRLASVTGKPLLEFKSPLQIDEFRNQIENIAMQPRYFTIFGNEIELAPTPDAVYTLEMIYRQNIPALAPNTTNWLLALAPDLYLYGALMEAAPSIKEDQRIQTWGMLMATALNDLNELGKTSAFNAGPMTVRVSGQVF